MSKKKSIIILAILTLIVVAVSLVTVPLNGEDSVPVGESNYDFIWVYKAISLGLDLQGGMYAVYIADLEGKTGDEATAAMDGTISNLQELLFNKGYTEAVVTSQTENNVRKIRVEVPDIEDTETLMSLIGDPAELTFTDADGNVVIRGEEHLKNASVTQENGEYQILLQFNDKGTTAFANATAAATSTNKVTINIVIDGETIMSPQASQPITGGTATISTPGGYTYDQAYAYATKIQSGLLGVKLTLDEVQTISPSLGKDAMSNSLIAAAVGICLIIIFMILIYKLMGVAASMALIIYVELLVFFLAAFPWVQLTLPGIAGVLLSIGMAVDANVIIFERIKDELSTGRSLESSIKMGFKRATPAIIDGNVTTLIGAVVMWIFGATTIKSFAITLFIGIVLSMFTALIISRVILYCIVALNNNKLLYGVKMPKAPKNTKGEVQYED